MAIAGWAIGVGAASAEDAVVLRTSAPSAPAMSRVAAGQMLTIPQGASVTLLYRGGEIVTLPGTADARVRAPLGPPQRAGGDTLARAALDRPAPARFAAATRTDEDIMLAAMRRGETPTGDYIADLMAGCVSVRCKAMLRYADETAPRSLFLHMRDDAAALDITANFSGAVSCWAVDPGADARALPPLRVAAGETSGASLPAPTAGFIGCVGAAAPLPPERRAAFAGARTPEAFDALAHDDVVATVRWP